MKGKLIHFNSYKYMKDGQEKSGRTITLQSLEPFADDDGRGNVSIGYPVEEIYIPRIVPVDDMTLQQMVGLAVEIVKEQRIGDKRERITNIELL